MDFYMLALRQSSTKGPMACAPLSKIDNPTQQCAGAEENGKISQRTPGSFIQKRTEWFNQISPAPFQLFL